MNVSKPTRRLAARDTSDLAGRLEQAEALLAYEGGAVPRLAAVRSLLSLVSGASMPERRMRPRWSEIARLLLKLDDETVTKEEIRDLRRRVGALLVAVRNHRPEMK
jgi:hypothetical protein